MTLRPKSLRFRPWLGAMCIAASLMLAVPAISLADDATPPDHDARLDGYSQKTVLDGGTASTYIVMVFLGAIGIGVMFIKGKRTHLD